MPSLQHNSRTLRRDRQDGESSNGLRSPIDRSKERQPSKALRVRFPFDEPYPQGLKAESVWCPVLCRNSLSSKLYLYHDKNYLNIFHRNRMSKLQPLIVV